MGAALSGVAYIWIALAIAILLAPRSIPMAMRGRALMLWAISAPITLAVQEPLTALFACAAVLLAIAPIRPADRAAFFLITIPAVSAFISAPLPFPGINFLTELTYYKLAAPIIFLPLLFYQDRSNGTSALNGPSVFILIYAAYVSLLIVSAYGPTVGMRYGLDQLLVVALPYIGILIAIRKQEDVEVFLQAFLVASLMLAVVAVISSLKRWDILAVNAYFPTEIRGGTIRINATAGTHSLAFHLAAGVMVLEFLKHRLSIGWMTTNAIRVVLIAGMLTADSRGALGGLLVAFSIYRLIMLRSAMLRAALTVALIIGAIGGIAWLTEGNVDAYDEHGTFSYRQELFWTSVDYISQYPFIGDRFFLQSGKFDHLLQGQGIIDITNLYLQIALSFGLIGLTLFSCVFVFPPLATGWSLLRSSRPGARVGCFGRAVKRPMTSRFAQRDNWIRASAVTVSICIGWLFLVATTSDVGLTLHIGVVFASLCNALRSMRHVELPTRTNPSDAIPVSTPLASA